MAELAHNNSRHASTGTPPFRALMVFDPRMGDAVQKQARGTLEVPAAIERVEELLDIQRVLRVELEQVYRTQKQYHDRLTAKHLFKPWDKV